MRTMQKHHDCAVAQLFLVLCYFNSYHSTFTFKNATSHFVILFDVITGLVSSKEATPNLCYFKSNEGQDWISATYQLSL